MLTLVLSTDHKKSRQYILESLTRDVHSRQGNRIWMVPELISHQTERELAQQAGATASRYAEVLSFKRLCKRVAEETDSPVMECLDNGGRVVAMAAAARQLHSRLKAYGALETKPEFLTALLDAVDEFKRCCILPGDLLEASRRTQGNLAQKLEELSLILEAYDSICAQGKRDPRDQMTWLLEQLEDSSFAADHIFYLDGFPDFSRQHMDIVEHLLLHSPQVMLGLSCDTPGSAHMAFEKAGKTAGDLLRFAQQNGIPVQTLRLEPEETPLSRSVSLLLQGTIPAGFTAENVHTLQAVSVYDECKDTAERILALVQGGCRYRDISVVLSDGAGYQEPIAGILQRAHIPFYLSGTEDILSKPVIHTVLTAMDAALSGFSQKEMLRYLKSMLSPVPPELCDRMENYAVLWSVDGAGWLHPWEKHPRGMGTKWTQRDTQRLAELEEARQKAVAPLQALREGFRTAGELRDQVTALYAFLEEIRLSTRLQAMAGRMDESGDNRSAQIMNQLWEILIGALEQLYDVLPDTQWDSETFTRLLKLLLSQYDVGTIPSMLDAVTVGTVSAMRCQREKHLFFLGANEGLVPAYGGSAGVLNDQERAVLHSLGVPVNPGAIDGLQTQFSELYEVFRGAEETAWVYCSGSQPSFLFSRLARMSGGIQAATPRLGAALTDPWEAAACLVACREPEKARQLGLSEAYEAVAQSGCHELGSVSAEHIRGLYGDKLQLSASQIDRLADCRLSYFIRYGLSAKERKPAQIDPAEFGTYVHAVLEECGREIVRRGGFRAVSLEDTLALARELSEQYFEEQFRQISTERLVYHFRKNLREVEMIVQELWEEMQESSFAPRDFELSFGEEGKMPPISISGRRMQAELGGFVDRVDTWEAPDGKYVRVVDYKTGKKDFDYCDVFNGLGLQMLLYLYALEDGGEAYLGGKPVGAGVQYFPARVPMVSADGSLSPEAAAEAHSKDMRRKGLLLEEEPVLYAMEHNQEPRRLCVTRKKDGTLTGNIASREQFAMLKKYVFRLLSRMVDEIGQGQVTADPYTRGSSHNPCRYCPYGMVCHPEQVEGRRNYQAMTAERFWQEIEREEKANG